MEKSKELSLKEQKEGQQRFFLFCVDNNNDLHNVLMDYEDSEDLFRIFAMLMDKKGKPIRIDQDLIGLRILKEEPDDGSRENK